MHRTRTQAQHTGFSDFNVDESALDTSAPGRPAGPVGEPWRAPPRTLGERKDRETQTLRAELHDLRAQLQAARDELEAARLDGALALPGLIRRDARRLGVDLRQSARDLYGALLLSRVHVAGFRSLDGKVIDQVRNSLARAAEDEIDADEALETIAGALRWRDDELVRRLDDAKAVHPGPPANPCRVCGQELGTNAADCAPCALARPGFLVDAP